MKIIKPGKENNTWSASVYNAGRENLSTSFLPNVSRCMNYNPQDCHDSHIMSSDCEQFW